MRNTVLVVTAALALAIGTVPTIAAETDQKGVQTQTQDKNGSAAVQKNCADILANRSGHTDAEIRDCQAKQ